ncbi:MAG: translesion DNA synthesis-associated protein ImuA [Gammaproteobacteria bacterium]|nr:translesion DNA synthesis-associated protein ImuA [Gammaproteobacteria bacterium]MDE2250538.1 translesion DNA synthesis-associated protein ImuA [Gammaproteobacteria bacterium]
MTGQALRPTREELRARLAQVGRSAQATEPARPVALATGFAALDAVLPGGGWPVGAITELMPETQGIGELSLLMPALAQLGRAGRYLAWIAPPCLPYPPALAQHGLALERLLLVQARDARAVLWAIEQTLRCPAIGAVLAWPASLDDRRVRRLQLAAEAGGSCGLFYRSPAAAQEASPAALRLRLRSAGGRLQVEIQKARGGHTHAVAVHPAAAVCA